ncbi:uroporphyrinogen decarboxylase [Ornithobacterium rhinotracheale]|uniref:Uroporphyrinogen decarboxylase n=1 Tax=Ornithobacterium rhinotracheale TaxID=28251 RepID=A0A3R5UWM6_ORNRH|nr:uroporphyrinogen decarboxylase [Ornithobacterium rhinotracheale]QAR31543.1 uroporphyrinogen decarboxylase [Ornithobacterium rhinotracheale]
MPKNDLLLKALRGEEVPRPPVWMMRQAGRYLPEFIALRDKYDFFTRCQTPALAAEITLQPYRRFPIDAAIIFSDILVVPQAMGLDFEMKPGVGPWLENPVRSAADVAKLAGGNVNENLQYVFDAIDLTKEELNDEIPLIGFAGSPWTIFCYAVQGQGSKNFDKAKAFAFTEPELAHQLLQKITDATIFYLKEKAKHGCDVLQIFDSWGGMLSPKDYQEFSYQYIEQIVNALYKITPVVVFAKGCWFALEKMATSNAAALGVDWTITPQMARELTGYKKTLQGNFDPARLLSPPEKIQQMVKEMIDDFGTYKYIANLGHGILPNVPVENAEAFIQAVVNYKA